MSKLKKISLGVLLVLIVLLGALGWLLGTERGLHFALDRGARWVPGLAISRVEGGWRDLTLKDVRYAMPGVDVAAGQLHLGLNLACLRSKALCVNDLSARDVQVTVQSDKLPPSAPKEDSGPLTEITAPLPITLRQLSLHNVTVKVDDTAVALADFRTGLNWQGRALTVTPTQISGLQIALPKAPAEQTPAARKADKQTARTDKANPPATPLGETLHNLFAKPLLADLPSISVPLDLKVEALRGERIQLSGPLDLQISDLLFQASTTAQRIQLDTLTLKSSLADLQAQGQARFDGDWPVDLAVKGVVHGDPAPGEKIDLTLRGAVRDQLQAALTAAGPLNAQLSAKTELAKAGLPLALSLTSKQVQWPLTGKAQYQLRDLALQLDGKATGYTLKLHGAFNGQGLPAAQISANGKGNEQQFALDRLRVAALQGHTDITALADWSNAISWRGEITLDGLNTARQWPDWPAKLNGSLKTRGSVHGGSWQLQVPALNLTGSVKQNPLELRGALQGNAAGQWTIPGVHLLLGRNKVDIEGQLNRTLNLDAVIDAPHLDNILPGLGGVVQGKLHARGELAAPVVQADLTASRLRWQDLSIHSMLLKGDISSADQIQGQLTAHAEGIRQGELDIRDVALDARGNEKQHQLRLTVDGKPVAGELQLSGAFNRDALRWQGALSRAHFATPVGDWQLSNPVALDYRQQTQSVDIGAHCWRNPNAEVCAPETIHAGASGKARLLIKRFDLAMLRPFLDKATQVQGRFSGEAAVAWQQQGGLPQAKVTLNGQGVQIAQHLDNGTLPVAFDTLALNASLENGRALLDWRIYLNRNGHFDGRLQIADPQGKRELAGDVSIDNLSLTMLQPLLEKDEKIRGLINARLKLGGNLQDPLIYGNLKLDDADVDGSFMPVDLTRAQLAVDFRGKQSTLDGLAQTTHGQLTLKGNADWRDLQNWRAHLAAKGDRLRVAVPPMAKLDVTPDLTFDATPTLLQLGGKVDIPWARIEVKDLPESATPVSSDEVVLDNRLQPVNQPKASTPISSNLIVHVGDDVRMNAFDLKARLNGDLKVIQDQHGLGLHGQINIPSGRFHAYGQDLLVRKGLLIFSGPPQEPSLNVEAIRNPEVTQDDVIAGVKVTGLADQPKLEVFSEPAMSQEEALSYLLRGQGLEAAGGDSNMMTSMLIGMGISKGSKVVGKIGQAFGVQDLALDTEGAGDSSQVVVSGYILPRLQVKYGVGIFDSLATLTLRYRLMPKLYLEAVSGIDQALDLLYQFEF